MGHPRHVAHPRHDASQHPVPWSLFLGPPEKPPTQCSERQATLPALVLGAPITPTDHPPRWTVRQLEPLPSA